jgi:hypothetical protein
MNRELNIPTTWEETTRLQFAAISEILFDASAKKEPAQLTRLRILEAITGNRLLANSSKRAGCTQKVAEYTRFIFKVTVNKDIAAVLSPEFQEALAWCLPEEVQDKVWVEELANVGNLLEPAINFNFDIRLNLLPEILVNSKSYPGPVFSIDKFGILKTNITAGEYFDALEFMRVLGKTSDLSYLANIAGCFYRTDREKYNSFEAQQRAIIFKTASPKYLKAVWFLMLAWQYYFLHHPVFGILFSEKESDDNKINIGSSSFIYGLSREGYGSIGEVSHMHIDDFFAIQVKNLKDAVNSLRAMKKNDAEVAKDLKLPISTVLKL